MARSFLFVLVVVLSSFVYQVASACAVCGAADKTLPARGEEFAFSGRLRATLDGRAAGFAARATPLRIVEVRLVPGAAAALGEDVLLSADVPLLRRTISSGTDAPVERFVPGDAEAKVAYVASRTRTRRLSFSAGLKAPTAPLERDAAGRLVPTDLQPGCGSVVPNVGATYAVGAGLVSAWATASLLLPVSVREGPHPGDSFRTSLAVQLQPGRAFAARVSANARVDAAGDVDEHVDKRSGGASLFVAPELVASPLVDLVVSVGAAFPAMQGTRGHRVTTPIALVGLGWDF